MKKKEVICISFLFLALLLNACEGYNNPRAWYPLEAGGVTREQALNDCIFDAKKEADSFITDRIVAFTTTRDRCMTTKGFVSFR